MEKIKETFFVECEDHIVNMETSILELEQRPEDMELMNAIFRAAHSMKGNSGCLGFDEINSFTHTMETVLDRLRNGETDASQNVVSTLLESVDCVKALVASASVGTKCDHPVTDTLTKLQGLLGDEGENGGTGARESALSSADTLDGPVSTLYRVLFTPGVDTMRCGIDPMNSLIVSLDEIGTVLRSDIDSAALPPFEEMDPESSYMSWNVLLLTDAERSVVEEVFDFIRDDSSVEIMQLAPVSEDAGAWGLFDSPFDEYAGEAEEGAQAGAPKMLGEILVEENAITPTQLGSALKKQEMRTPLSGSRPER
jgi:two-component system chemotaxis sensor kinase CheA